MPIQVVYPQTLVVVSPGDAFGHLVVNDASALVVGAEGYLYHQTKDPIFVKVVDITGNTLTVTFNSVVLDTSAYGPASGADIHFDHQAVDSTVVPPTPGVGINIAAGTNTASSGTVNFVNSNGVTFGLNTNNAMTVSVVPGAAAGVGAAAAGTQTMTSGTLAFANSNNVSFTMNGSSQIVASASFAGGAATVFSNSNNVTFGLNGSTVTASATWPAQSNQPVAVSGSNGSFAFSTLTMGNSNGLTFYTTNGSVVGSYTVPTVPGATVFSNSNNVTFGLNGSTVTASATVTYPAQTVQPVAASASNGSYNFSTLKFVEGSGVTWATQANGIQASVKTDYQSSNANYQTTTPTLNQVRAPTADAFFNMASNQVQFQFSNTGTFTTNANRQGLFEIDVQGNLQDGADAFHVHQSDNNPQIDLAHIEGWGTGVTGLRIQVSASVAAEINRAIKFTNTGAGGAQTLGTMPFIIPVAMSNSVANLNANFLQGKVSTDFLTVQSTQPVAISGSNGSSTFATLTMGNSNGLTHYMTNGSLVGSYTVPTIPGATVFSNSNNVSFGLNGSTITATATLPAQTQQPMYFSAGTTSTSANTLQFGTSAANGNITFAISGGSIVGSAPSGGAGFTAGISTNGSGTTGTINSQMVFFPGANITLSQSVNGGSASLTVIGGAGGAGVNNAAGGVTQGTGTVNFANSNNVSFGLSNNGTMTASASFNQSVQPVAASGSNGSFAFSTLTMGNSNGLTFYTTNGSMVGSYTVPTIPGATVFSNSNNVTFGLNGSTVTATATFPAQTVQPVAASGSNGSFAFSTLTMGNSNGLTFYTTNGSMVGSYTVPTIPGATVFSNSNNVTFGLNGSTVTATATFPAQTVQPVAASASNGSFNFSTIKFVEGSGVTWATQINGIQASVKTDYQSSNANYLTSQSNQAVSGTNGSVTFQTLSFTAANGASFYTSNNSAIALSYTVPNVPAQTQQPMYFSAGTTSTSANTLQFGSSAANGNVTFAISGGSVVGSVPAIPGATVFSNSNNVTFGLNGSTVTATATFAQSQQPVYFSAGTTSTSANTLQFGSSAANGNVTFAISGGSVLGSVPAIPGATVFSNSNNVTFGLNGSTVTATATFPAQTVQPVAASASNGSFNFSTIKFVEGSGVTWATQANGIQASVKTDYQSSNANYLTSQSNQAVSGTNGSVTFQTLSFTAANGASFYTSNNSAIALSYTVPNVPAQTQQPMYFSAGTTSTSANTLQFGTSAANGNVTFAISGGSIVGSAPSGGAFSAGNSTDGVGTTGLVGNQLVFFPGANITLSQSLNGGSASLTVVGGAGGAGAAVAGGGVTQNTGTVNFANSNNITFGLSNNGTMTASFGGGGGAAVGISTAGNTQGTSGTFSSGSYIFEGSNGLSLSQITNAGSPNVQTLRIIAPAAGITAINISAGTTSSNISNFTFSNANSMTFGLGTGASTGIITASYDVSQLTVGGNISLSNNGSTITLNGQAVAMAFNAATTQTSGTVVFSNSNGLSWGYNLNTVTAALTRNISAVGNTTGQSSSSSYNASAQAFSGAGAISVGNSGGSFIISANSTRNLYVVGNTTGQSSSSSYGLASHSFSGAGIVSVGNSGGSFIISATQSAQTGNLYAVGNTTGQSSSSGYDLRSVYFSGGGNISVGNSGGTFIISQTGGGGGAAISAAGTGAGGNNSQATGTVNFANSNNVTFGLSNNGVMTASFNAANTASTFQAGMSTFGNTAGTTGLVQNNIVFVGTNDISLSQSVNGASATLTIDGGSPFTALTYNNRQLGAATANSGYGNNSWWLVPMRLGNPVSASTLLQVMSMTGSVTSNQTNTVGATLQMALYKQTQTTNISRLDSMWSTQAFFTWFNGGTTTMSFAFAHGGTTFTTGGGASSASYMSSVFGLRMLTFTVGSILDAGLYAYGVKVSTSSAGGSSIMRSFCPIMDNPLSGGAQFMTGASTVTSIGYVDAGVFSAASASPPVSFVFGDIRQSNNLVPYVKMGAI
jgi:hypothetical protein